MSVKVLDVFVVLADIPDIAIGDRWPSKCPGYKKAIQKIWPGAKEEPY
jgi:hypothetical protein